MEQQREPTRRGDSFDIGSSEAQPIQGAKQPFDISQFIQNPSALASTLGLSTAQAKNVQSLITGAGAGLAHKFLSGMIGDELAGAVGGYLGAYVAKRVIKGQ